MATTVGKIGLDLVVNDKEFKQQMNGIQNTASRVAKMLAGAFAVKKLVDFGAQAIKLGSDLAEVQNVVDVAFPKMSQQVDQFAKNAMYASGLSETMAKRYTGTFGAMAQAFGFSEQEAYDMSTALTSLAGDVASFYNINQDEAYTKLKSVFTGETETLKDLGVVMTQTALDAYAMENGFGRTTQQMSETEKVALRFAFVTNQLAMASGDFARTSSSWANQVRILRLQFESFMASVGQGLINLFTPVIQVLNFLLSKLLTVGNAFKALTELLTGKKATQGSGIEETADAVGDLADNMSGAADGAGAMDDATQGAGKAADGAGKAAKKAAKEMKSLMGFDQINKLSEQPSNDDGGGSGGSGGGKGKGGGSGLPKGTPKGADVDMGHIAEGETTAFDGLFKRLGELLDLFKQGFDAAFRVDGVERLQEALGRIAATLQEIFTDPQVVQSFNTMLDKWAYAMGQFAGSIGTVALGIGVFIAESVANGLERQKERIKQAMVTWMDSMGSMVESAGNIAQALSNAFYEVITSEGAVRIGSAIVSAFISAKATMVEIGAKYGRDLMDGLERIVLENAPNVQQVLQRALSGIAPVFETIEQAVNDFGDMVNRVYDEHISPFIEKASGIISRLIGVFVEAFDQYINPVIEKFGTGFSEVYEAHLKPALESIGNAFGAFMDLVITLWQSILEPFFSWLIDGIMQFLGEFLGIQASGLLDFLAFLGDAIKLVMDVLTVVFNVLQAIIPYIAEFIGLVGDIITGNWDGVVERLSGIPEWFGNLFQMAMDAISSIFSGLGEWFGERWESVKEFLSPVGTWFQQKFQEAWQAVVSIFQGIGNWFGQRWNDITTILANVGTWFTNKFKEAWTGLTNIFSKLGSWFGDRWKDVTSILSSVGTWFGDKFTEAFNAVKNAFSGIGSFFSGLWETVKSIFVNAGQMVGDAVGGAFKMAVNGVLGTIENIVNGFIGMINSVLNVARALPGLGWLGSIDYVNLPRLAQGGFVRANTPQIAMIGDNKHYGEIVAPENKMLEMARKAEELTKDGGNSNEVAALLRELITAVRGLDLTLDGDSLTRKVFNIANDIQRKSNQVLLEM